MGLRGLRSSVYGFLSSVFDIRGAGVPARPPLGRPETAAPPVHFSLVSLASFFALCVFARNFIFLAKSQRAQRKAKNLAISSSWGRISYSSCRAGVPARRNPLPPSKIYPSSSKAAYAARDMVSRGALWPVHSSKWAVAWWISICRPSMIRAPWAWASLKSRVSKGR